MMKRFVWILTLLTFLIAGCNQEAEVPTYIYINEFDLQTDKFSEGTDDELITDAWVFLDDESIGVFDLPSRVPILVDEAGELVVRAGVKLDGINANRSINPFYTTIRKDFTPQPATVDTLNSSINYVDDATFPVIEDFENAVEFTNMTRTSAKSEVFEGKWSGVVRLDTANFELASSSYNFNLPSEGVRIFLELNYRSDVAFDISLLANTAGGIELIYAVTVLGKEDWNKIYVDLTEEANQYNAFSYSLVFTGQLPNSMQSADIYFDNIKIVHL